MQLFTSVLDPLFYCLLNVRVVVRLMSTLFPYYASRAFYLIIHAVAVTIYIKVRRKFVLQVFSIELQRMIL